MTYEELIERTYQRKAFTLPEALLALFVVGIVASITIPAMIANKDKREWIAALNKSYSIISEGFKQSQVLNNDAKFWTAENFHENFIEGFRVQNFCDDDNSCVPEHLYLNGNVSPIPDGAKSYVLTDGQIMTVTFSDPGCTSSKGKLEGICGTAYVDVNGLKKPNTWGKDYFAFYITSHGIVPYGSSKIDVVKDGYTWVSNGCHTDETVCTLEYTCNKSGESKLDCETCGGKWTDAHWDPVYAEVPDIYRAIVIDTGTQPRADAVCSHTHTYYYCCGYTYYGCNCYAPAYNCTQYTYYDLATPAYYTIASYSFVSDVCSGASTTYKCLTYKFTTWYDCWYDSVLNVPYEDEGGCNDMGFATKDSCDFHEVDALGDCNIVDGKGTSCGAWAIINNNMIYLDGKQVSW